MSNLLEKVSEEIHIIWMCWAKDLLENEEISDNRRKRWEEECFKPYINLSTQMKELDRKFARRILKIVENG